MEVGLLRLARLSKGNTLDEVHQGTGIDPAALSRIERGLRPLKPKEAKALADFLGVNFHDIHNLIRIKSRLVQK